jgi:class 3 adenylate cyclase
MDRPETRYVGVGDADVAYQVVGDGPIDLLYCYGLGSHIERVWDHPVPAGFLGRLALFSRLIIFDRRGTGASDGVPRVAIPTWESWTEDIGAVLDAAGARQAAILASLDAGALAVLFAALHPERVSALALVNTSARFTLAPDYPIGAAPEVIDALVELITQGWGKVELAAATNPSMSNDFVYLEWVARTVREAATPRTAAAQFEYLLRNVDIRPALPLVQAPTLVFQVQESPLVSLEAGRYVADRIAGARLRELPGGDVGLTPSMYVIADELGEMLTGTRPVVMADRVLTTVLFSDIVDSTARASMLGDRQWREVLDAHDHAVREQLRWFKGREVNTTGDGFVASFDGPTRALACAVAMRDVAKRLGLDLRIGIHTGECELRGDDLAGLAVHLAARIGAKAETGEILASSTVKDLVIGSGIEFNDRGESELKGVPGTWRLYAIDA